MAACDDMDEFAVRRLRESDFGESPPAYRRKKFTLLNDAVVCPVGTADDVSLLIAYLLRRALLGGGSNF